MQKPIVWTIAGSDSGGGAGIQADLHTFQALNTFGCSVITGLTAQNSHSVQQIALTAPEMIDAQIAALESDLTPKAIKTGMMGNLAIMQRVTETLLQRKINCPLVCDPVMVSTSGAALLEPEAIDYFLDQLMPLATVITPNIPEASVLVGQTIRSTDEMIVAANVLLSRGAKSVLIKGGHQKQMLAQDYWTDGNSGFWLQSTWLPHPHTHGSGCSLAAAIAACLALGHSLQDALVIAKTYVHQGIRLAVRYGKGPGPIAHLVWPAHPEDFPAVTDNPVTHAEQISFPKCDTDSLGFYPIVDNIEVMQKLFTQGVLTVQLRIKNQQGAALERSIIEAIHLAKKHNACLFINDYWDLALQHHAYGVHLGQEDLLNADLKALAKARIHLGISCHNYWEAARAQAYRPSYIALGPIYQTTSKNLSYAPQGLIFLQRMRQLLNYPLVAIGGIHLDNLTDVLATQVDGVAVISAISQTFDPIATAKIWQERIANHKKFIPI